MGSWNFSDVVETTFVGSLLAIEQGTTSEREPHIVEEKSGRRRVSRGWESEREREGDWSRGMASGGEAGKEGRGIVLS